MAQKNYLSQATGFDSFGHGHLVTVMGYRHSTRDEFIDTTEVVSNNGDVTEFSYAKQKRKVWHLDLVYTIQHTDDSADAEVALSTLLRRLKKKEHYLSYETEGNMRPATVQAIVDAEAKHIASKVDSFIKKINDNAFDK